MFDNIKDAMTFTKGERVAIIVLAAVILLLIAANFFVANRPSDVNFHLHNLDSIWALHDKSKDESLKTKEFLSRQVTKSPSHHVKTKSLNVSKSELNSQKPKAKSQKLKANSPKLIVNINSADTLELQSLPGIGSFFARNIVSYREKLGGFTDLNQMLEVYAFDSARLETITPYINIDSVSLRKISINTDDFKTILRHPYIEYEDVKKIVNYRESKGMIRNWEEYLKVVGRIDVDY